jgi:hypothetical protein
MPATPHTPGSSSYAGVVSKIACSPSQYPNIKHTAGLQSTNPTQQQQYLTENNPNCTSCQLGNQYIDGGNCAHPKSMYSVSNNQQNQTINSKVLEDGDENIGVGPANSNIPDNGSSSTNTHNTNHQHQEFNLDDLNFVFEGSKLRSSKLNS